MVIGTFDDREIIPVLDGLVFSRFGITRHHLSVGSNTLGNALVLSPYNPGCWKKLTGYKFHPFPPGIIIAILFYITNKTLLCRCHDS